MVVEWGGFLARSHYVVYHVSFTDINIFIFLSHSFVCNLEFFVYTKYI